MTRLEKFRSFASHAWLSRIFNRLSATEFKWCESYLIASAEMERGPFETQTLRLWLDEPLKPKHHKEMLELLVNSNALERSR